jgi:hypothetical protein
LKKCMPVSSVGRDANQCTLTGIDPLAPTTRTHQNASAQTTTWT